MAYQAQANHSDGFARIIRLGGNTVTARINGVSADSSLMQIGNIMCMETPQGQCFGVVTALSAQNAAHVDAEAWLMEIELLGETLAGDGGEIHFERGISVYPLPERRIRRATPRELAQVFSKPDKACVRIGELHQDRSIPMHVAMNELLGKHFAIFGASGAGKSCALTVILNAILRDHPNGHIILLDFHDEYDKAFGDRAHKLSPENLNLPYWLLNMAEARELFCSQEAASREEEEAILLEAILEAKSEYLRHSGASIPNLTVETPAPYSLPYLVEVIDRAMGRLNKASSPLPYRRILERVERLLRDRRLGFMFSPRAHRDDFSEILGVLLRFPTQGKPLTLINLSSVPEEVVNVVVSLLARIVFDFAQWSAVKRAIPLLFVCEEAHRYIPKDAESGFAPTRRSIARIAKEGRKYGLSLGLITQRPSEVSQSVLSQCGTVFALRMSSSTDQEFIAHALPDSATGLMSALPAMRTGEAIVFGEAVTLPMRVRLDSLRPEQRPRSGTADFAKSWTGEGMTRAEIAETIARWRKQGG